jgi:hypothetical protein
VRRLILIAGVSATLAIVAAAPVAAGEPTCSRLFNGNPHGYHVVADYVTGIGSELLGGPGIAWPPTRVNAAGGAAHPGGPYHGGAIAPGASFCTDSNSPGIHF